MSNETDDVVKTECEITPNIVILMLSLIYILNNGVQMRKTDKKIDNAIRDALIAVCDQALVSFEGFQWLTHRVNYDNFPNSLNVICVFSTDEQLAALRQGGYDIVLRQLIKQHLTDINVVMKDINKQVTFDSEQACAATQHGKKNPHR